MGHMNNSSTHLSFHPLSLCCSHTPCSLSRTSPTMPSKRPPPDPESDHDVHGPNIPVAESSTASIPTRPKKQNKPDAPTAGIVYISRLPPGMTPQKVRHLMARWGEVGRVYAQRRDGEFPVPEDTAPLFWTLPLVRLSCRWLTILASVSSDRLRSTKGETKAEARLREFLGGLGRVCREERREDRGSDVERRGHRGEERRQVSWPFSLQDDGWCHASREHIS